MPDGPEWIHNTAQKYRSEDLLVHYRCTANRTTAHGFAVRTVRCLTQLGIRCTAHSRACNEARCTPQVHVWLHGMQQNKLVKLSPRRCRLRSGQNRLATPDFCFWGAAGRSQLRKRFFECGCAVSFRSALLTALHHQKLRHVKRLRGRRSHQL